MRKRQLRTIASLTMASMATLAAWAKVPEPDTIVCGTLRTSGASGVAVHSGGFNKIRVQAVVNGEVLSSTELSSTTNSFVLRIPMDDGVSPRIPGTAKSSDLVKVVVVNETEGIVAETQETQMENLEIPEERGSVIPVDFRVDSSILGDDPDGNGYPDSWKLLYATSSFAGVRPLMLGVNDSNQDNDGDGLTNFGEYVAGTDPLDPQSTFSVKNLIVTPDLVSVRFGPIVEDRLYSLLYRKSLSPQDDWKVVDQYRAMKSVDETTWESVPQQGASGFYSLRVELMP